MRRKKKIHRERLFTCREDKNDRKGESLTILCPLFLVRDLWDHVIREN